MKRKRSGTSRNFSIDKVEGGDVKQSVMPTAIRQIRIGVRKTMAYAFTPTRQRTSRLKNSRNPERPDTTAVMIMAATNGPNGFGPLVRPRIEAIIDGYQDSTKAITKNAIKVCRLKKALIPSHFETSSLIESRSHATDIDRYDYAATMT